MTDQRVIRLGPIFGSNTYYRWRIILSPSTATQACFHADSLSLGPTQRIFSR